MLVDKDSIVTVPFRAFLSNGTAPDTGLSNDSIRGSANGAAQFTLTNKVSAVSANAGMYVIVTTASETSNLGTLALWYDQGNFPQHIANLEVVNSNPFSQMSNIAAKTYSGVTFGSLATLVAFDYSSVVTVGVGNMNKSVGAISGLSIAPVPGDYSSVVTVGVGNVNKAVGAISGLSFLPAPGEYSNVTMRVSVYSGNTPQTGDAFARLGAPAGASVSADVAAVKSDTGAIKTKTDQMVYTVANRLDATINSAVTLAAGTYSDVTIGGVTRVNSSVTIANADYSAVTVRASNITIATGGIVAASFGAGAVDAVALATDAGQEIADRVLLRNIASGSDGGRSVAEALYALRNRVAIDGSIGTVYATNDTSSAWTFSVATVSVNSGLVNQIDPG